jgi:transposase
MQVIYERCAGVDVGKDEIAVAVRLPGKGGGGRKTGKRTYRAFYGVPREMARWLESQGVTRVAMEATGTYSAPACHALMESGFEQVLVCNAGHVKNVPGRKAGLSDAEWLAQLLECGLLRGGFIPPADVKAVRDLVRYRAKVARQRVSEVARLGDVLQDAGIKAGSVASSVAAKSGRLMIGSLIDGERRGAVLAGLALGKVRSKVPDLSMALEGRFGEHHAMLCRLHLDHIDYLEKMIAGLDARVEAMMVPFRAARRPRPAGHHPRDRRAVGRGGHLRDRRVPPRPLPDRRAPGVLGRALPRQQRVGRQAPLREEAQGQRQPAGHYGGDRLGRGPPRRLPQGALPPARHAQRRVPLDRRQEQGHRHRRPRRPRDHLARPDDRQAV